MPSSTPPDALLHALAWLTRRHGSERSVESLRAGLAASDRTSPEQAVTLLREAGFNAGVIERGVQDLDALLLPAVLLTKDGGALVVIRRLDGGALRFEVIRNGADIAAVPAAELEADASGFVLVATPRPGGIDGDPGGHWLWGTLRRFVPCYRAALLAALLTNVLTLMLGMVTMVVFDKVIPHQAFVTLWALAGAATIALLFDTVARQLRSHLIDLAGKKTDLIIGSRLVRQTLDVRLEHRPESAGSYAHHLAQVEVVRDFSASATLSALSDLPFVVLFVVMIFVIGGPLGWVMVVTVPLVLGLAALLQVGLRRTMRDNMNHQAEQQAVLVEAVEGLEDLKAAGAQGRFLKRHDDATAAAATTALRARRLTSWTTHLSGAAQQLVTIVMLVWGVYLIEQHVITGGALIGAVMFAGRAIGPLSSVVALATRWQSARAALSALDRLMKLPTEREPGRAYIPAPALRGRLAARELGFAYPARGGTPAPRVLNALNLVIEPGERVAMLGRIGSGKSSVLRLLAGLYQPLDGRIEVDGIDLRQIDPADYRAQIGFVSQEPRLFRGSLRDNVAMGRSGVDAQRLDELARLTGLDRVVGSHPLGWDRPVGEMGALLSGGQRQLVALARCLAARPKIVLMDEPTSSMDAQSELTFLRQLNQASAGITLVMVTHRPAVLELVQRVVVIDAGQVVLDGPKAQVLAALSAPKPAPAGSGPGPLPTPYRPPAAVQAAIA